MPTSLRNIVLPPKSRAHLPHAMTYEEVRVYATHVHGIPAPPHKAPEHAHCCGKPHHHSAEVTPASYNVVKKQHTIVDYDSEAAKAKVDDMHKSLAAEEVSTHARTLLYSSTVATNDWLVAPHQHGRLYCYC